MSIFLAAIPTSVPQPMHHVIDSIGFEPVLVALFVGMFMGVAMTYWWSRVGFSGMLTDVKNDISLVKVDVARLKATTPIPVVVASPTAVTPSSGGSVVVNT